MRRTRALAALSFILACAGCAGVGAGMKRVDATAALEKNDFQRCARLYGELAQYFDAEMAKSATLTATYNEMTHVAGLTDSLVGRARCLMGLNRPDEARADYQRVVSLVT